MNRSFDLSVAKEFVEKYMTEIIEERKKESAAIHPAYRTFWDEIGAVTLFGGKRIRPYLTFVGAGGIDENTIKVATAQELLHIAVLIHDDIIDKDLMRHGAKNVSGRYTERYQKYFTDNEASHYANSTALLAGDMLIAEAHRCIQQTTYNESIKHRLHERLYTSMYQVIAGELLDVEATFVDDLEYDPIKIYELKTASYSLVGPLLSGAYCADLPEESTDILERFGHALGIAYQIQDDLLGLYGNGSRTGKSTTGDLREGKCTLLVALHEARMNDDQRQRFSTIFAHAGSSDADFAMIREDMITSGARAEAYERVEQYYQIAEDQLMTLQDEFRRSQLSALVDKLRGRES